MKAKRNERYHINFTMKEKESLKKLAAQEGVNMAELIRYALLLYARATGGVGDKVVKVMGGIPARMKNII